MINIDKKKQAFGFHSLLAALAIVLVWTSVISSSYFSFSFGLPSNGLNPTEAEAASTDNMSGFAWSDTIGWVSFNCTDTNSCASSNYGVNLDTVTGNLFGYAWSEHIGWIKFGGLSGFPSGSGSSPQNAQLVSNNLIGFARACAGTSVGDCSTMTSRTDGWDGWISLNGTGYGVTLSGSNFQNYAWGSDIVGWLQWNPSFGGVVLGSASLPIINFSANPTSVPSGSASTLTWTSANATSCLASGGWTGSKSPSGGSESTGSLTVDTSYSLTCTNAFGSSPASATVLIQVASDFSLSSSNNIVRNNLTGKFSPTIIKVNPVNSFSGNVSLSASPSILGGSSVTYVFGDSSLSSGEYSTGSSFTIQSASPTPIAGVYQITITGVSGSGSTQVTRTVTINLNVSNTVPKFEEF